MDSWTIKKCTVEFYCIFDQYKATSSLWLPQLPRFPCRTDTRLCKWNCTIKRFICVGGVMRLCHPTPWIKLLPSRKKDLKCPSKGNKRPNMQYWTHSTGQFAAPWWLGETWEDKNSHLSTALLYWFSGGQQWSSNKKSEDKCEWIQGLGTIG